jgi:hypothetical protein
LSSGYYFNVSPPGVSDWTDLVQRVIFRKDDITQPWMRGEIGLADVAAVLADETGIEPLEILGYLRQGCTNLGFNEAVYRFARWVQTSPLKSALVTVNMDVFSDIIVPSHGLDRLFDVIVNSADVGTCDKSILWPMAFHTLGDGIAYHHALLIEDGEANPAKFQEHGRVAYQYRGDPAFHDWLCNVDFGEGEVYSYG